ncbi:hypothetical protein NCS52_00384300 [Fusarium sp. LHS14.1]|nr:hypothetical protein NCS52_00384300 [Fusarium sp. LHS14.1]
MPPQTIQEALTGHVPTFVLDVNAPIQPKPMGTWMRVYSDDVWYWEGFNLTNLRNAYGHIFDLPNPTLSNPIRSLRLSPTCAVSDAHPRFVIRNLDELKKHGIETLHHLLKFPLQHAIPKLKERLVCCKSDLLCDYRAPHTQADWLWSVFYATDKTNLVVSCSRLSNTFTSEDLRLKKLNAMYTLRQLATYAVIGKTRYGFILTDKEVVIVRFHVVSREVEEYGVGWVAIPWKETGPCTLTVPLALFSLALMSLNDDHRHIVVGDQTLPLDAWVREKHSAREGKVRFYHHLSGQYMDELPEGVHFYWERKEKRACCVDADDARSNFHRDFRGHGRMEVIRAE